MRTYDDLTEGEARRLLVAMERFDALHERHFAAMQEAANSLGVDRAAQMRFHALDDQMRAAEDEMHAVFAALGLTPPWKEGECP